MTLGERYSANLVCLLMYLLGVSLIANCDDGECLVDAKDGKALGVCVRKFTVSHFGPQDVESQKARSCYVSAFRPSYSGISDFWYLMRATDYNLGRADQRWVASPDLLIARLLRVVFST